jgi:hypothetical protein
MRTRELLVLAAALIACATGCLRNPDPRPRSMTAIQSDAHGGYAVMRMGGQVVLGGELIAIGPSGVWILFGDQLIHTPLEQISDLEVHPYSVAASGVVAWGVLGTLSTISHGFFLVLSAPVWIATSTIAGAVHSRTARETYVRGRWPELTKWARFPQGLPPGVTATELLHGRSRSGGPGPPSSVEPLGPPPSPPPPSPSPPPAPPPPVPAPPPAPEPPPVSPPPVSPAPPAP